MRVLIVDDNLALAENLGELLEDEGHRVRVVDDAAGALQLMDGPAIDFALIDICLDGDDGVDLAEALRQRRPELRLALMTAYSSEARRSHAEDLSIGPILPKPVPLDVLVGLIGR